MKNSNLLTAAIISLGILFLIFCFCTRTVSPSDKNMRSVHSEVLDGDVWIPAAMTVISDGSSMLRAEGTRDSVTGRVSILTIETGRSDMKAQQESWERADSAEKYVCAGTRIKLFRKPGEKSWNRAEEFIAFIDKGGSWCCVRVFQPVGVKDCSLQNFAQVVLGVDMVTAKH